MTLRTLAAIAVTATAASLTACGSSGSKDTSATTAASNAPVPKIVSDPHSKVSFVTPADGATVGSSFTAKVKLKNFRIDPKAVGQAPRPGVGHLHFTLDNGKFDYPRYSGPNGKIGQQLGVSGKYSPALAPAITYAHVSPGSYTLLVVLANNNHTSTGVSAKLRLKVR